MKVIHHRRYAFSLIEVTLALGVAVYSLLAVFGLLSVGVNTDQASVQQTTGANLVKAIVADLRAAPANSSPDGFSKTPQFGFQIPSPGQAGSASSPQTVYLTDGGSATGPAASAPSTTANSVSKYRVSVAFIPPASSPSRMGTSVRVLLTWPASADRDPNAWPSHYTGSIEIVTTLDRN